MFKKKRLIALKLLAVDFSLTFVFGVDGANFKNYLEIYLVLLDFATSCKTTEEPLQLIELENCNMTTYEKRHTQKIK